MSPFPAYSEPALPGRWQPTPPAFAAATFTHVQKAGAARDDLVHAVPAGAAADVDERRLRHGSQRGEGDRLFALMNVSIHDALQTTLTSKFVYGLWRPVTPIQQADTDLNRRPPPNRSGCRSPRRSNGSPDVTHTYSTLWDVARE